MGSELVEAGVAFEDRLVVLIGPSHVIRIARVGGNVEGLLLAVQQWHFTNS